VDQVSRRLENGFVGISGQEATFLPFRRVPDFRMSITC